MNADFSSIHNYHEQAVYDAVMAHAAKFPLAASSADLLADVACIALNKLSPRYIRHQVDLAFYLTEKERDENGHAIEQAVLSAFEFVQARRAMRARL